MYAVLLARPAGISSIAESAGSVKPASYKLSSPSAVRRPPQ